MFWFGCRLLDTPLLSGVVCLLHTLWEGVLGSRPAEDGRRPPGLPGPREPPKLLALHLVDEFLYVLLVLARHLR